MQKLLLIDTFNFLHRAFHALPKTFSDKDGNPTNAIYGVTSMLINIFEVIKPDFVIAAVDGDDTQTLRAQEFSAYKAQRKPMDPDLASQIDPTFEIIDSFGIKRIYIPGYEADDVIGTVAKKVENEGVEVIIASNDRDLWQLVNSKVHILLPNTKGNAEWLGEKEVKARLGFDPIKIIDYKSLKGDPSDNIPGVMGVGEKTANSLIETFGTLENIYEHVSEVRPESLSNKLQKDRENAFMSKKLATIVTDVPFELALAECKYTQFNKVAVKTVLEKHNFKSLIRRLGFETSEASPKRIQISEDQTALF